MWRTRGQDGALQWRDALQEIKLEAAAEFIRFYLGAKGNSRS
jgi:hypothetical protein